MKTFIAAILMIAAAVTAAVTVTFLTRDALCELHDAADRTYTADISERAERAESLRRTWHRHRTMIAISINKSDIEEIDALTDSLCELSSHSHKDTDYYNLCRLIYDAFRRINDLLDVSVYGFI